jgi:ABC-type lipoprotein export system ATPase subunit
MTEPTGTSTPTASGATIDTSVAVSCDGVGRRFGQGEGAVWAVRDVTCRLMAGERVALTGPSGSGKSTLLHLLAGLDEPTSGRVSWPAIGTRDELRPARVAVVFQGPSLVAPLDVVENVALPLILAGETEKHARAKATAALDRLGLGPLAAKLPGELSGGQAQRVAIARALAGRPALVLVDEPTGQLDHVTAAGVIDTLLETVDLLGATLIMSTHDLLIAERLPGRWVMHDGALTYTEGLAWRV